MSKSEKEKLQKIFDDLIAKWKKANNGNDEYSQGKMFAYEEEVLNLKNAFPFLSE
jgi:hypothetical protein